MKIFLGLVAAVFLATGAMAAEIPYRFKVLDITVPGQDIPVVRFGLYDINDHGQILAAGTVNGEFQAIVSNGKKKHEVFNCPGFGKEFDPLTLWKSTEGSSISDRGHVVGYCAAGDDTGAIRTSGLVRNRNGDLVILDFPNANGTMAQAVSPNGRFVTGVFWGPGNSLDRFHCFLWDRRTREFTQIDFDFNTYNSCYAINERGQILGEYKRVGVDNSILEHGFFIYDNGIFTVPLPLSHGFEGGTITYAYDFNDDGAIIGLIYDSTGISLFFFDDGKFYTIKQPENWIVYNIGGMNNQGDFVGGVKIKVGVDPECFAYWQDAPFCGIYEDHGFVATPAPIKVASKKK